jgi:hypothetical protein
MDAKTMRAALSAAIRVTVSTSLIGCGGQATSDAGAPATPSSEPTPPVADERPRYVESSGGSVNAGGSSMVASAGMTAVSEAGAAGAPEPDGCEAIAACLTSLGGLDFDDPLPDDAAKRCCSTLIWGLSQNSYNRQECAPQANGDFFSLPAHATCCTAVNGWGYQACTPWGPPVPPELPRGALLAWRAVA